MDVDGVTGELERFLRRLEHEHPPTLAEVRRIEIDVDQHGVARIATNAGAGWQRLGPG